MPKYTVRQTYTKADVWFDIEANSEEEAIEKMIASNKPCDDEEFGIDTFTEAQEIESEE